MITEEYAPDRDAASPDGGRSDLLDRFVPADDATTLDAGRRVAETVATASA